MCIKYAPYLHQKSVNLALNMVIFYALLLMFQISSLGGAVPAPFFLHDAILHQIKCKLVRTSNISWCKKGTIKEKVLALKCLVRICICIIVESF